MSLKALISEINSLKNPQRAEVSQRFFKTGKGQYGEGDIFLGLTMPQLREVVKKHLSKTPFAKGDGKISGKKGDFVFGAGKNPPSSALRQAQSSDTSFLKEVHELLQDKHHEFRMAGVLILVEFARKGVYPIAEIADFYMAHTHGINNWDLVDASSEYVIGPYVEMLGKKDREAFIKKCIASTDLWTNRIIVLASFYFIKKGDPSMIMEIADKFLTHKHDLMHKAVGWMLREVGKRCSEDELKKFLDKHAHEMPRTMLRYAIERLGSEDKQRYMSLKS